MRRNAGSTIVFLILSCIAFAACSDSPAAPRRITEPSGPPVAGTSLGEFRVDVDLTTGTMRFVALDSTPRSVSIADGLNLATYGTQGTDVRLFSSPVVTSIVGARQRFTADVGLKNLKAFAIGDEQRSSGATPLDTMGIYIFQSNPVISCAPGGCDVLIFNEHGTGTFTAPNQKYFWYRDRVLTGDTTRANSGCTVGNAGFRGCQWVFDASLTTTGFSFFVQIRAAWEPVAGGDTEFPIVYEGDSLPESRAEPRWDITSRSTAAANWAVTETGTELSVNQTATNNVTREYIRRDSIRSADLGFLQVTMYQTTTSTKAGTFVIGYFGIDDNNKFLAVGLNKTQVGFITSAFAFITGQTATTTPASSHSYKLVKNGASGDVQLFIDGSATATLTLAYSSASWSPSVTLPSNDYSFFFFGHRSGTNGNGSDPLGPTWTTFWDQVMYKIGNTS